MLKSIFYLMFGSVFGSALAFITQAILAKELDITKFGEFSSSLALVMLLSPLIAFGCDGYFLRYYAEKKGMIKDFISNIIFYWVVTAILVGVIYFIFDRNDLFFLIVVAYSQSVLNFSVSYNQAKGNYGIVSVILMLQNILRIILILGFMLISSITIDKVIFIYVVASLCVISASFYYMKDIFVSENIKCRVLLYDFIKKSYPYGVTIFLHLVYFQSDIVLVNWLVGAKDAGFYSVAFTLLSAAYLIPSVLYQKYLLPRVHQFSDNEDKLFYFFKNGFIYMLLLGGGISFLYFILSDFLVNIAFGIDYEYSSFLLKILSVGIFFRYLSSNSGVFMMGKKDINIKNKIMLFCAVFNIISNIYAIPKYGSAGAAVTTVLTEFILCFMFYFYTISNKFNFLLRK
ncbi:polysaccharide biosynthesis family protein [Yersinia ruckeri]|uniref:oligosaccharide flippase family protein n=1 Tax=Yersinia ruckeri TaxID=29486 RepID=UPI0005AC9F99|nr:oligosaccharide flippase family protein [Yersinia ruckeri]AJI93639.1 polysaccharide biosynthesis family protein [Yersinia ruckeri]